MATTTRNTVAAMVAAGALLAAPRTSAAQESGETHVRSSSPAIVTLIKEASERSATLRQLVATIEASDTYVYVNEGDCGRRVRACLAGVTMAGPRRVLWVKVDTRKADWDLMGSIGHELRHAVEVLGSAAVTSSDALYMFYERNGMHASNGMHETLAALDAGNAVRDEVRRFNREARRSRRPSARAAAMPSPASSRA
jgi:hypothetical protein